MSTKDTTGRKFQKYKAEFTKDACFTLVIKEIY